MCIFHQYRCHTHTSQLVCKYRNMPESDAAQFFLYVASICVIALTLVGGVVAACVIRLVMDTRSLIQMIRMEMERLSHARRLAQSAARAVRAWVSDSLR